MITAWEAVVCPDSLLIAYGGPERIYRELPCERKLHITCDRLRTRDHQRDRQSYHSIIKAIAENECCLEKVDYVHLAEFDLIPLCVNINDMQRDYMVSEGADLIGYGLQRIDQTNSPHYLAHASDSRFAKFIESISVRREKNVVLSMFGFGTFWSLKAFSAIAKIDEPFPIYLEIFMPTVAHHLGFRVRGLPPSAFISTQRTFSPAQVKAARRSGEWFIHPVKDLWTATTI